MKCQCCRTRNARWVVGSDGFGARAGAKVCDAYACRLWADKGYPVTYRAVNRTKKEN
jgi:hypothetical protein